MRKTFLVLLAGLLFAGCAGKAPKNGALIQGEAAGYDPEETVVALLFQYDGVVGAEIIQRIKVGYARGWLRDMVEEVLK